MPSTAVSGGLKAKKRLIFRDNQADEFTTYRPVQLLNFSLSNYLNAGSPKIIRKEYTLFFGHMDFIPLKQRKLDMFSTDYYLIPVNHKGKKSGSAMRVNIADWDHGLDYDPAKELTIYKDYVTGIVGGKSADLYLAQTRSLMLTETRESPASTYKYFSEHEFNIMELDPASGDVELIAQKRCKDPIGYFQAPMIRYINNNVVVMGYANIREPDYEMNYYFTVVKP